MGLSLPACIDVYIYLHTITQTYVCMYVRMNVPMYVCMLYVCVERGRERGTEFETFKEAKEWGRTRLRERFEESCQGTAAAFHR